MRTERLEFGGVRKFLVMSVKTCYRSVWYHPFLVGLVCFLIFLYRSFPLLFSVLVTASPVLVCTAVLLGTLLCFGSPNIPEIEEKEEEEEKVSHGVSPLKTRAAEDDSVVVERDVGDGDFIVERHVRKRWDIVENDDEKVSLVDNEVSEVEEDDGSVRYKPLVNEDLGSRDIHFENGVIDRVEGVLSDSLVERKREIREMLGSEGLLSMEEAEEDRRLLADEVRGRNLEGEGSKFAADFGDVPRGDELDASLLPTWKRIGDDKDDDDASLNSGSDGAESSSPDASMADIIPMLDELHPLLSSEAPQPAQMSHDDTDAASERSHDNSNVESVDSDELENQGEDEDEGEGVKGDKEDESKSAIKWTEDDQKNLMDLGTLELERNQRLETLIARRRSSKSMRLIAEKNLIDLDSGDIPLNIAPITATRHNPFDLPYDSYDDLGLPPIPGSAPSNLQPRRNPFDLPYDSSEEKPDLKGDSFEEEFSGFNHRETVQREAVFRRHESFSVGPSFLVVPRQELKWKPYFVPEQLVTEGTSTSSFLRQSSEVSESKLSSVPDTESVSSVVDEEDNKPNEQDVSQETELILNEDHASVHDEQDSLSSGDVELVDVDQAENRDVHHEVVEITLGDRESLLEMESNVSESGATTHVELDASEILPRIEPVEEGYSSRSSLSSLSEIDEKRFDVKGEGSASSEPRDHVIKESGISTQPSFAESDFHFTSGVDDDSQHKEPVYDSSPSSVEKFLSFSSVSFEARAEEPSLIATETREVNIVNNDVNTHEVHDAEDKLSTNLSETDVKLPVLEARSVEDINLAFKQLDEGVDVGEVILPSMIENQQDCADINSKLPVVEVRSVEDIDLAFKQLDEGVDAEEVILPSMIENQQDHADTKPKLPVVEVRSVEDIDSAFKQLDEGVDAEEVILPSMIENQQDHADTKPKLPVVEVRSVEDIDSAFKQLDEGVDVHDPKPKLPVVEVRSVEDIDSAFKQLDEGINAEEVILPSMIENQQDHADTKPKLPVVEVRSVEDIDSAFKQLDEGVDAEEVILPSMIENQQDHADTKPKLPVVEVRSVEDIDSAFKQLDEGVDAEEVILPSMIENQEDHADTNSKLPVVEVRSVEDIDSAFKQLDEGVDAKEVILPSMIENQQDHPDTKSKLPVVEMKSVEDINLAFKQLDEGVDIDEVILPSMIENQQDQADTDSKLPVVEVRSVEDIDLAFKQLDEGVNVEEVILPSMIENQQDHAGTDSKLPVVEMRSVEDIDLAFRQLDEGVDVEEVILPSMIESQQEHADINSKIPVVEARSLEDIHNALQQGQESNPAELPRSSDLRNSSEVVQHDVASTEETEINNAVSGNHENSENAAAEPKRGIWRSFW